MLTDPAALARTAWRCTDAEAWRLRCPACNATWVWNGVTWPCGTRWQAVLSPRASEGVLYALMRGETCRTPDPQLHTTAEAA